MKVAVSLLTGCVRVNYDQRVIKQLRSPLTTVKVPLSRRIRRGLLNWLYRRPERLRVFFFFFVEYQHDDNINISQLHTQ